MSWGAATAVAYAARHPRRVRALALVGGFARGEEIAPPALREALVATVRAHWGAGSRALSDIWIPGRRRRPARALRPPAARVGYAPSSRRRARGDLRRPTSARSPPRSARRRSSCTAATTARSRTPLGRELAASLQESRFVSLDGNVHLPWLGDSAAVLAAVDEFLERHDPAPAAAAAATRRRSRRAAARPRRRARRRLGARRRAPPRPRRPPPAPVAAPARPRRRASPRATGAAPPAAATPLSDREREVLQLVAEGLSDPEIAARLVVSPHTVHRHVANIRTKLGQPTRAAAAAYAARSGLI